MKALDADKVVRWAYHAPSACSAATDEQLSDGLDDPRVVGAAVLTNNGRNVFARAVPSHGSDAEMTLSSFCSRGADTTDLLFSASKELWRGLHDGGINPIGIAYMEN
jgi:hypothetical protein